MIKHKDIQRTLASAMGLSLSRLNAKINQKNGAEFNQQEMAFIKERYGLSAKDMDNIFFAKQVS